MDLSVVIPIFNEEGNLPLLYERLTKTLTGLGVDYEIIFVNDGSRDNSLNIIKGFAQNDAHVRYISFSRNFGHQTAFYAGMENSSGGAVVCMDGDLQDQPELIPQLYEKFKAGYDVVYARRRTRKGVSPLKKFAYKLFYRILARITDIDIPLDTGDFRITHRKVIEWLKKMPEQPKFLRGQIAWVGFRQTYIEYDRDERYAGDPGYTYGKLFRLALDGITSFSDFPLKLATVAGFTVSGISFMVALYTIYARFYSPNYLQGWASTMVSILFIGGIQLIGIGIIGEYISRITTNVQRRPVYIIDETNLNTEPEPSN